MDVGRNRREGEVLEECGEDVIALVKLVIPNCEGIEAELVENSGDGLALVESEEEGTLELIPSVEEQRVFFGRPLFADDLLDTSISTNAA